MMMKIWITIILVFGISILSAKNTNNTIENWERTNKEIQAIREQLKTFSDDVLNRLPWTYEEYYKLWGAGGPLENSPSVILFLNNIPSKDNTLFLRKIVSLSIGAMWEADHVNYLQATLHEALGTQWHQMLPILNKLTESETKLFWRFIFSGPGTPNYEQFKLSLLKKANQSNYKYVDEISDAYNYNLKLGDTLYAH